MLSTNTNRCSCWDGPKRVRGEVSSFLVLLVIHHKEVYSLWLNFMVSLFYHIFFDAFYPHLFQSNWYIFPFLQVITVMDDPIYGSLTDIGNWYFSTQVLLRLFSYHVGFLSRLFTLKDEGCCNFKRLQKICLSFYFWTHKRKSLVHKLTCSTLKCW
jgi:hypothetical protein